MISYPSTSSKFTATFQADSEGTLECNAFTRSKSMLRLKREDATQLTVYKIYYSYGGGNTNTVSYYSDPEGVLEIPLRNTLQGLIAETPVTINISMYNASLVAVDALSVTINIYEGISYYDIHAPRQKDNVFGVTSLLRSVVMPPNVLINQIPGYQGKGIIVESNYHSIQTSAVWSYSYNGTSTVINPVGARLNELSIPANADSLTLSYSGSSKTWTFEKPEQCADVVVVRWTSQTGARRQHYFPIMSFIKGSDKQVSLLSPGDGYRVDKNSYNGVRCRLTGLTSYGYWYYADLFQASDVHAVIQPTGSVWETEINSSQTAAYIEANEAETPQGNGFFNFEFTIKMRHYGSL